MTPTTLNTTATGGLSCSPPGELWLAKHPENAA